MPEFKLKIDQQNVLTSSQLKGTSYILDFWNIGCFACVESFPKMNLFQKQFEDQLKIIAVALEDKKRDIRKVYEGYQKKMNLQIISAYDSSAYKQFVPFSSPHLIWVDPSGIVKAITWPSDVTENNLQKFLAGQSFSFQDRSLSPLPAAVQKNEDDKTSEATGNAVDDTTCLFRSSISLHNANRSPASVPDVNPVLDKKVGRYQVRGATIEALYSLAIYGTVLLHKDSREIFPFPDLTVAALNKLEKRFIPRQRFDYSIELPRDIVTRETIQKSMINDLSTFFGLSASLKRKDKPCLSLVVTDKKKFARNMKNSGKMRGTWLPEEATHTFNNIPIDFMLRTINSSILTQHIVLAYNDTGYKGNISFKMRADVNDLESVRKGLRKVGMDLVQKSVNVKVIEITEEHE